MRLRTPTIATQAKVRSPVIAVVLKVDTRGEDLGNLFREATAMQFRQLMSPALGTILLKKKSMLTLMMVMIGSRLQAE